MFRGDDAEEAADAPAREHVDRLAEAPSGCPTHSRLKSGPPAGDRAMIASTGSASAALTVCVAPSSRASVEPGGDEVDHDHGRAADHERGEIALIPTVPAPKIAIDEPARRREGVHHGARRRS